MNSPRFQTGNNLDQLLSMKAADGHASESDGERPESSGYNGELKSLLGGFLETIVKSVGARAGAIRMLSPDGRELHIAGAVGLPPKVYECESHVDLDCGVCGEAVQDGAIHSSKVGICARRSGHDFFGADCKRVVAVPLEFRGNLIGVFNLFFASDEELTADASRLLRLFAELIGISLENARFARENRRMNLMAERQAIANEIHDSLAQNLVYGRMRMSMLQEALRKNDELLAHKCLNDVNEALDSGQKSVRELITHFRCQMDPLGLQHALQVLVNDFCERTGIALEYSNRVTDPGLPLEHELQVYNIVREVLANIAAHSGATQARMLVSRKNGRYAIAIEDNGVGISGTLPEEGHYGLSIMRERAQRIGAEIEMESSKGLGTKVRLSFMAP
jgi:two-component system, NarL family, nitrate/nitrite sensor histidine kinase NarX